MFPIKIKDEHFLLSDFSLFSLLDKETQTESKCNSEQEILMEPDATEQEVANLLDYCKALSDTGIFDTKVRIKDIKQHTEGVISAKSSHGTFLLGNILQRNDRAGSHLNRVPTWKLDDSIEKEFPNRGYIYIPCFDTENSNKEDIPDNACVFIPDQSTCLAADANEDENIEVNLSNQDSIHTKISKSSRVSFKSNNLDQISLVSKNSKNEMSDEKDSSHGACPPPSELRASRLNDLARGLKTCLSNTLSVIVDPICNGVCKSRKENKTDIEHKIKELCTKDLPEYKVDKIQEVANSISLGGTPSKGTITKVKKSVPDSNCGPYPCDPKSTPATNNPPENGKEEEKPCILNKPVDQVIENTYPALAILEKCSLCKESTLTLESKPISPLFNEMSPNNEFATEDFLFSKPSVDGAVDFTGVSSNATDEDSINIDMKVNNIPIRGATITKIMEVVESTVASLKEHLDLDRISSFKRYASESEESQTPSSEYFIRAVAPEIIPQGHQFVPPPRTLFTSFKSIFGFFGSKNNIEAATHSSSSETSNGWTIDEAES